VLDSSVFTIAPSNVLVEVGDGVSTETRVNGVVVSPSIPRQFVAGDVIEVVYNFAAPETTEIRFGLGVQTTSTFAGSITLTQPQVEAGTERSSFIQPEGSPAQRDASTPTVPNGNIPTSETVVYDEYINLATYGTARLLWAYADSSSPAAIAVTDSGTGGDTLQLLRIEDNGTLLAPLAVTLSQPIARNDLVLVSAYLKSDLFTLIVENKTTGETAYNQDASIAGDIGGLGPIALGDAGTIASTFSRKLVDFEVTAYTAPDLPVQPSDLIVQDLNVLGDPNASGFLLGDSVGSLTPAVFVDGVEITQIRATNAAVGGYNVIIAFTNESLICKFDGTPYTFSNLTAGEVILTNVNGKAEELYNYLFTKRGQSILFEAEGVVLPDFDNSSNDFANNGDFDL
jgi:hypothetical protein